MNPRLHIAKQLREAAADIEREDHKGAPYTEQELEVILRYENTQENPITIWSPESTFNSGAFETWSGVLPIYYKSQDRGLPAKTHVIITPCKRDHVFEMVWPTRSRFRGSLRGQWSLHLLFKRIHEEYKLCYGSMDHYGIPADYAPMARHWIEFLYWYPTSNVIIPAIGT